MTDYDNLLLFISISSLLCLAPGPDNLYVMTLGLYKSKKAVLVTTLGLCSGLVIHTFLAIFGVSVIFQTSPLAFDILKTLGALYLLYLSYKIFIHRGESITFSKVEEIKELKRLYVRGFFMNILNPKVAIFFLAFLPQFVQSSGYITLKLLSLGAIFALLTFIIFSTMGFLANYFSKKFLKELRYFKYLNLLTSFTLFVIAMKLFFTKL